MVEDKLSISERLLLIMHNLGLVRPELAKPAPELIANALSTAENIPETFAKHEAEGYIASILDREGNRRYYLTPRGILKVCSSFT